MKMRINATNITASDLLEAAAEVHKLPPKDRNWEGRMFAMLRLFKSSPDKMLAIDYRLVAMSRMLESGRLPGWAMPQAPDGSINVSEAVWKATAEEPLVFSDADEKAEPWFDETRFLERVLSLATPEGNA